MDLHIEYGQNPSDLLDSCMEKICKESIIWPKRRAFMIVPEQTKADMERRYLSVMSSLLAKDAAFSHADPNALMLIDVVSFQRFAHRILSEIGNLPAYTLDDATKTMLIHRVLIEGKDDFRILSSFADRIGFVPELDDILGDFSRYHVTHEDLSRAANHAGDPNLSAKMNDFSLLLEQVTKLKENIGYCDSAEKMSRFISVLDSLSAGGDGEISWPLNRLSYLRETSIWVIGFGQTRNFTPEEWEILDRLAHIVSKITVSVCSDILPSSSDEIRVGSNAFYFGRQTLWSFVSRYSETHVSFVQSQVKAAPEILFLADSFAYRRQKPYVGEAEAVSSLRFSGIMEELRYVAGEIRRLVLDENYRYRDISVVFCDLTAYEPCLHAVFSEYGLDPFLDRRRPLSGTALVRFVLSLLDLGIYGFSFPSLMNCVKSGICHITSQDADILENYCLKHGLIRGFRYFDAKNYAPEKDPDGPYVYRLVERVILPLRDFLSKMGTKQTCAGKAELLLSFLYEYGDEKASDLSGIAGQVHILSAEWVSANNQEAALALVAAFNKLTDILVELQGPIGDTPMSLQNFRGILQTSLEATLFGAIPSYIDQIQIADVRRGYQRPCKVMFLVGGTRANFPYKSLDEGILRGTEREYLASEMQRPFPSRSRDQVYADSFVAYALLAASTKRLYLTSQLSEEESAVFASARSLLPQITHKDNLPITLYDARLYSDKALARYVRIRINDDGEEGDKVRSIRRSFPSLFESEYSANGNALPEQLQQKLEQRYSGITRMSVSEIEKYAACPFSHFGGYVLRLQKRPVFQIEYNDLGTVLHSILELSLIEYRNAIRQVSGQEEKRRVHQEFAERDFRLWAKDLFDQASLKEQTILTKDTAFIMNAGNKILRIASHSLPEIIRSISPDEFEPKEMEWVFGKDGNNPLEIRLSPDRVIHFSGTIDRVDLDESSHSFRIIDYKSGDKHVDYPAMYQGLSVQLPAYLHAYAMYHPDLSPESASYFYLTAPDISFSNSGKLPSEERINEMIMKEYKPRGVEIDRENLPLVGMYAMNKITENCGNLFSGDFSIAPAVFKKKKAHSPCAYCLLASVCGIDPKQPPYRVMEDLPMLTQESNKRVNESVRFIDAIGHAMEKGDTTDGINSKTE